MKTIFKISTLFILCLSLFSCEDVVQIKLDKGSKLVVIDAFVTDQKKDQVIRVLNNNDYFATNSAEPITNAQVVLKDLTASKQFTFNYVSNGNYVYTYTTTETLAVTNHQYQLNVVYNGNTYSSLATLKRTATILEVQDSLVEARSPNDNGGKPYYTCFMLTLDEADNKPDYYWVKTFRNDTLFDTAQDINVCVDGTGGEVYDATTPFIFFTPPAAFLGFKRYVVNDSCKVEVHSVSKDCYNFLIQAQAQISNGGLFATTPENVRTNITSPANSTKAVGWFNMASVALGGKKVKQK
jgi:Domain of unknown function (DUF4249)